MNIQKIPIIREKVFNKRDRCVKHFLINRNYISLTYILSWGETFSAWSEVKRLFLLVNSSSEMFAKFVGIIGKTYLHRHILIAQAIYSVA